MPDQTPDRPLYILLCSGEHEKVQMAAMMASVAAVSNRAVEVFVSMNAIFAFRKDAAADQRYRGGDFSKILKDKKAPDALTLFEQGKELGDLKVWACSMALDVLHWEMENLAPGIFNEPLGLTKFLSDAEQGQFVTL
ncbi:MAG: DsrE/DsrF/DrsH-like family protein [Alphaproteobacteria bacterium]|nr:DsrE/DsrF/DrsH-like family protein [Alphaproteobacteria bacterium]MBU6472367.1 DsrE/DsrF/DrsH-like family protein [Alphaproteobacteria bacterium]MDE2012943.1 DsrE/DsrF/DrsH-like family protein [Alphaproteobacteria bacterium]MDE2352498.1 DsrE/DsrF/DrsH-like family protein [Alphaproteobacteria bacterium]